MRLIGDYISYIKDIRRYSARTQAIYSDALKVFVEDCGAATDEELLKSLTPQIIRSHASQSVAAKSETLSGFHRQGDKKSAWAGRKHHREKVSTRVEAFLGHGTAGRGGGSQFDKGASGTFLARGDAGLYAQHHRETEKSLC